MLDYVNNNYLKLSGGTVSNDLYVERIKAKLINGVQDTNVIFYPFANWDVVGSTTDNATYFKALITWLCKLYPGRSNVLFIGLARPNSVGVCLINIYDTSKLSNNLPEYASGVYFPLASSVAYNKIYIHSYAYTYT